MNDTQRKIILVVGFVLAPVLFWGGVFDESRLVAFAGPLVSIGVGLYVWAGRTKDPPTS